MVYITKIEGIVIIDLVSGVPLFSKINNPGIDDALLSGFISAINSFSKELSLGELSSIITNEKFLYLISRENIIVAIINSEQANFEEIYSLSIKIAEIFEEKYYAKNKQLTEDEYKQFNEEIEKILGQIEVPFTVKVANFIKKEYGGTLSLSSILTTNDKQRVVIDIIADRGKKKAEKVREKIISKLFKGFSEDVVFVKVIDGVAGQAEVKEFVELMKKFGKKDDSDDEVFPYFPSYCVIVAKGFSPTIKDYLNSLEKEKGVPFIRGDHIVKVASLKTAPSIEKCYVHLWKWKAPYPEKFN